MLHNSLGLLTQSEYMHVVCGIRMHCALIVVVSYTEVTRVV